MTEKLYEINAYTKEFTAKVLECVECDKNYKILLDKTAFFPEGGGQAADVGFINDVRVFDAQIENDNVYHYAESPIEVGSEVCGKIDFDRRFNFMQNHTGEHIVSGIAHMLFGVNNVGFHLGEELVTIDFDKELTREQLDEIEHLANKKVWQNLPVVAYFPSCDELLSIDYRSKKEIDGNLRLVDIKDTDVCACCAPHVNNTGEIGIIKLLDCEKMRGGIRIVLKCGAFALSDYRTKCDNVSRISALLSAKQENVAEAVEKLDEKSSALNQKINELKKKLAELTINFADKDTRCIFANEYEVKDLQLIADGLHKKHGGIKAAFSLCGDTYAFAICGDDTALQELFAKFKSQFNVRGGGRNGMVQGSVTATEEEIRAFFD